MRLHGFYSTPKKNKNIFELFCAKYFFTCLRSFFMHLCGPYWLHKNKFKCTLENPNNNFNNNLLIPIRDGQNRYFPFSLVFSGFDKYFCIISKILASKFDFLLFLVTSCSYSFLFFLTTLPRTLETGILMPGNISNTISLLNKCCRI